MKSKTKFILILLILISSIPILFIPDQGFYALVTFLNFYILSPLCFPILIGLPFIFKNKNFYFLYVLLIPILYNLFFIVYFYKVVEFSFVSILSLIFGFILAVNLKN